MYFVVTNKTRFKFSGSTNFNLNLFFFFHNSTELVFYDV